MSTDHLEPHCNKAPDFITKKGTYLLPVIDDILHDSKLSGHLILFKLYMKAFYILHFSFLLFW